MWTENFQIFNLGFRKGRGSRDQIANISWIIEKARESRKTSTSALLTMQKSLTVWITRTCRKFLEIGKPEHLTCLLRHLYAGQEAAIRTGNGTTDWFQIGKGVHQTVYSYPAYLIYMLRTSCKMLHWIKHKLESGTWATELDWSCVSHPKIKSLSSDTFFCLLPDIVWLTIHWMFDSIYWLPSWFSC